MFSVLDKHLLTDMGKTIVRKYVHTTDAQSVWRIVETLDEFQSITTGYGRSSSLKDQTYYDLLMNACVRYDRTKKANIAKRGHIYQTTFTPHDDDFISQFPSETPVSDPYMGIDTPSDEFYNINTNQSGPPISARHKP